MSEPIVTREREWTEYKDVEERWTYDQILEVFPDGDGSLVNSLVRRCQALEAEIERLRCDHAHGEFDRIGLSNMCDERLAKIERL